MRDYNSGSVSLLCLSFRIGVDSIHVMHSTATIILKGFVSICMYTSMKIIDLECYGIVCRGLRLLIFAINRFSLDSTYIIESVILESIHKLRHDSRVTMLLPHFPHDILTV